LVVNVQVQKERGVNPKTQNRIVLKKRLWEKIRKGLG